MAASTLSSAGGSANPRPGGDPAGPGVGKRTLVEDLAAVPARDWLPLDGARGDGGAPDAAFDRATAGGAAALPYRAEMEQLFGRGFAGVQAHLGRAEPMAELGAQAAIRGQVVAFAEASPSRATVAHELTHAVQNDQAGGGIQRAPSAARDATERAEPAEREADAVAGRVAQGMPAGVIRAAPGAGIQRLIATNVFKYETDVVAPGDKLYKAYHQLVEKLDDYHDRSASPKPFKDKDRIKALDKLRAAASDLRKTAAEETRRARLVHGLDLLIASIDVDLRALQPVTTPATPTMSPPVTASAWFATTTTTTTTATPLGTRVPPRQPAPARLAPAMTDELRRAVAERDQEVVGQQRALGMVGAEHDWTSGARGVLGRTTTLEQRSNWIRDMLEAGRGDILLDLLGSSEAPAWHAAVFAASAALVVAACAAREPLLDAIAGRDRRWLDRELSGDRGAQAQHWATLLVDRNEIGALLGLAGKRTQWRGAVLSAGLWPRIAAALPSPLTAEQLAGLVSLIRGDERLPLTAGDAKQVFRGMTRGRVAEAPRDLRDFPTTGIGWDGPELTARGSPPRTWRLEKELVPVAPTEQAMHKLLRSLATLPRSALQAVSLVAFVHEFEYLWRQQTPVASSQARRFATPVRRPLDTSYAQDSVVVLRVTSAGDVPDERIGASGGGHADSVGGGRKYDTEGRPTTADNLTRLSYFENHARHEFGHAVGGTTYGSLITGNDQAIAAGQWVQTDVNTFRAAMWTATGDQVWTPGRAAPGRPLPRTPGGPPVPPAPPPRREVRVTADDACAWMLGVLAAGAEPAGNPITALSLAAGAKLERISRLWSDQQLPKYLTAVLEACGGDVASVPSWAFRFPGYTPPDPVHIYCHRWGGYASYARQTWQEMHTKVSWYSLASPPEMFAELFTLRYSKRDAALPVLGGVDWQAYFGQLERQAAPAVAPPPATALGGPLLPGESEPPANLIPTT